MIEISILFIHKVVASPIPLPVIAGPCADAPTTSAALLPRTVHEVNFRVGTLTLPSSNEDQYHDLNYSDSNNESYKDKHNDSGNNQSVLCDGIVYLRLSHRGGWVADRTRLCSTSPSQVVVMKDITTLVELHNTTNGISNISEMNHNSKNDSNNDKDSALTSTTADMSSIGHSAGIATSSFASYLSSCHVATPASIIRSRKSRPRRTRPSNTLLSTSSMACILKRSLSAVSSTYASTTAFSDANIYGGRAKDISGILRRKDFHPHQNQNSVAVDKDDKNFGSKFNSDETNDKQNKGLLNPRPPPPTAFLMKVLTPAGLRILDAPHFQVERLLHETRDIGAGKSVGLGGKGFSSPNGGEGIEAGGMDCQGSIGNEDTAGFNTSCSMDGATFVIPSSPLPPSYSPPRSPQKRQNQHHQHNQHQQHQYQHRHQQHHHHHNQKQQQHYQNYHQQHHYQQRPGLIPWIPDSTGRSRLIPPGSIFEASKRRERAGQHTPGSGLLRLSDKTGWAIVPTRIELSTQVATANANSNSNINNLNDVECNIPSPSSLLNSSLPPPTPIHFPKMKYAYEEVGNARPCRPDEGRWHRVVFPGGVSVICQPQTSTSELIGHGHSGSTSSSIGIPLSASTPDKPKKGNNNYTNVNFRNQISAISSPTPTMSSDVGSTISSSAYQSYASPSSAVSAMFGAIRSSPRSSGPLRDIAPLSVTSTASSQSSIQSQMTILPRGACVQVEPWEDTPGKRAVQSYVRIRGGKGWIPRLSVNTSASISSLPNSISPKPLMVPLSLAPRLRSGSIWFRVQPSTGVQVRSGPSTLAPVIMTDGNSMPFRFECGEHLRASRVLLVRGHIDEDNTIADVSDEEDVKERADKQEGNDEAFARLYRNEDGAISLNGKDNSADSSPAAMRLGEWVCISQKGVTFLNECESPPEVTRKPRGWRYVITSTLGAEESVTAVAVRVGPSFKSATTTRLLIKDEIFWVREMVTAKGEGRTWLRIGRGKGEPMGRGWVPTVDKDGKELAIPVPSPTLIEEVTKHGEVTTPSTILSSSSIRDLWKGGSLGTLTRNETTGIVNSSDTNGSSVGKDIITRLFQNDNG